MFHEYALEPAVLSNWERTRFFLDAFGPWRGRFLAKFPKHWKRMVFERLRCPDVERLRIVERLTCLDPRVFSPRHGPYDPEKPWLENALLEHRRSPFRAIVADQATEGGILDAGAVDDRSDLWRVDTGAVVPREAAAFVKALELLLLASSRVVLVDPYFRADHYDKTYALVAFCGAVANSATTVEVHFSEEARGYTDCMRAAARNLPGFLPRGSKVTLRCWRQRPGGPRLHNRYVLTDIGGVKFGDSIEVGDPGHEDHLSILDEPSRVLLWEQFVGNSPGFDEAGPSQEFVGALSG